MLGAIPGASMAAPSGAERDAAQTSYEIVTVTRPESVEKLLALERLHYKLCAQAARQKGRSVQPFPEVPADYFYERNTWVSDGKAFMRRSERYGLDPTSLTPEKGCATRFVVSSTSEVRRGTQLRAESVSLEGNRKTREDEVLAPRAPQLRSLEGYTVAKSVAATRCRPAMTASRSRSMCA